MLDARRCRDAGDAERNGGLGEVEARVGVTEVDGRLEMEPAPRDRWYYQSPRVGKSRACRNRRSRIYRGKSHNRGDGGEGGTFDGRRQPAWTNRRR